MSVWSVEPMNRTSWDAGGLQRFAPVACAVMSLAMGAHGWLVLVECLAWWVFVLICRVDWCCACKFAMRAPSSFSAGCGLVMEASWSGCMCCILREARGDLTVFS